MFRLFPWTAQGFRISQRGVISLVMRLAGGAMCAVMLLQAGCAAGESSARSSSENFSRATVDFGLIVSDLDRAVAFYRDGLGFTGRPGHQVPAEMGGDSGLTNYLPFQAMVMTLGDAPTATRVKIIAIPEAQPAPRDTSFSHSTLGIGFLTINVHDIDAAVARAQRAGGELLAEGIISLPAHFPEGLHIACVRDPDGNIIELVGYRQGKGD